MTQKEMLQLADALEERAREIRAFYESVSPPPPQSAEEVDENEQRHST
jgi:hypothetical protein